MSTCTKRPLAWACSALTLSVVVSVPALAGGSISGDFNGDGFCDLALGVPNESVGGVAGAGAVNVIYGSASGLDALLTRKNQVWHQNKNGIEDVAEASDSFGAALAVGDFDNDGFSDLAIGVPGEDTGAGAVNVIYGTANGLKASGDQIWTQNTPGVPGANQVAQLFGSALAVGDFNNDGRDDLAIGVPAESENGQLFSGAVVILYGTNGGLSANNSQMFDQDDTGLDSAEMLDAFGTALTSGDFNNDGFADLAIGSPAESIGSRSKCGAVHILLGSGAGLTSTGAQFWHQDSPSVANWCQDDDAFGASLAAGDFDNDGFDDLAVGVPAEGLSGSANAGAVHVFYGEAAGVGASRDQFWHQDKNNILEQIDPEEAGEGFGTSLAAGFFNNDAFCDLAIGVPNEDLGAIAEAGVVQVLYGRGAGLKTKRNQVWSQNSSGIADKSEDGDHFGFSLAAGDFDGDGIEDLAVGVPGETYGTRTNCGAANVIYGGWNNLNNSGNQRWHQNRPDIAERCEAQDSFGTSVAP